MNQEEALECPLVTFAIFAYNQEKYIGEAIEGALAQNYRRLEIILSDDCSSDRTFELMQNLVNKYEGPHEITVRKNDQNLGIARHFDLIMRVAKGELVVVAAGDDISMPERCKVSVQAYLKNKKIGFFEAACINFSGSYTDLEYPVQDLLEINYFSIVDFFNGRAPRLIGAGRTYVKDKYTVYSPLQSDCPEEDTPAMLRSMYFCPAAYSYMPLVYRRIHDNNLSNIESLKVADFSSLEQQYYLDIDEACQINLINENQRVLFTEKLRRYSFKKTVGVEVHAGFQRNLSIQDVLVSKLLYPREKLNYFRKWVVYKLLSYKSSIRGRHH